MGTLHTYGFSTKVFGVFWSELFILRWFLKKDLLYKTLIYLWMLNLLNWHVFHISLLGDNLPKAPGTTLLHARFSDRQGGLRWPCFHVERKCRRQSANVMFFSQIFSCCYEEMKLFMLMLFKAKLFSEAMFFVIIFSYLRW